MPPAMHAAPSLGGKGAHSGGSIGISPCTQQVLHHLQMSLATGKHMTCKGHAGCVPDHAVTMLSSGVQIHRMLIGKSSCERACLIECTDPQVQRREHDVIDTLWYLMALRDSAQLGICLADRRDEQQHERANSVQAQSVATSQLSHVFPCVNAMNVHSFSTPLMA